MSKSIHDQLLKQGVVKPEDAPEAKRSQARAARLPEPEKALPPPFDAPARGVIVDASEKKGNRR